MAKTETAAVKKPNLFKRLASFFKDLRSEVKKVVWPTKKQVFNYTCVVLVAIIVIGIFVGGLDLLLGWLVSLVLGKA